MSKILIGSAAIRRHFPEFNREPKDIDYAVKEKVSDGNDNLIIPILFDYCKGDVATPEEILTLKLSHIFWDTNWDKHMWDIQFLLSKGIKYNSSWMLKLKDFWVEHYNGLYRSDLKLSKEKFFNNAIDTGYEHDYIHTLIADQPMYLNVLSDDGEGVELDESKYHILSHQDRIKFIQEEVMVMAWERWPKLYYKAAFQNMLKRFIRNHVPMFAFDFAIRNYIELLNPPFDFFKKINNVLQSK